MSDAAEAKARLRAALERIDLEAFLAELDPDIVWVGVPGPDGNSPVCRNRDQVRSIFERALADGQTGEPEVIAETDDRLVVDMHPEPRHEHTPELTQVFMFRAGKVVRMDDYPNRPSALAGAGLA